MPPPARLPACPLLHGALARHGAAISGPRSSVKAEARSGKGPVFRADTLPGAGAEARPRCQPTMPPRGEARPGARGSRAPAELGSRRAQLACDTPRDVTGSCS